MKAFILQESLLKVELLITIINLELVFTESQQHRVDL